MIKIQHISTVFQKFILKKTTKRNIFKKLTAVIFSVRKKYPKLGEQASGWLYTFQNKSGMLVNMPPALKRASTFPEKCKSVWLIAHY